MSKEFEVGMEIVDAMEITILSKDYNKMRSLRSRSMLAIDDLGKEPAEVLSYGNVLSPVVDLLEYRYQHQLFTAITTNLTAAELQEKYGVFFVPGSCFNMEYHLRFGFTSSPEKVEKGLTLFSQYLDQIAAE